MKKLLIILSLAILSLASCSKSNVSKTFQEKVTINVTSITSYGTWPNVIKMMSIHVQISTTNTNSIHSILQINNAGATDFYGLSYDRSGISFGNNIPYTITSTDSQGNIATYSGSIN